MKTGVPARSERPSRAAVAIPVVMIALWAIVCPAPLPAQDGGASDGAGEVLKWKVEQLRATGLLRIGDEAIASSELTLAAYEQRGFRPLWTNRAATESLLRAIVDVRDDGLDPRDYHLATLSDTTVLGRGPASDADLDLLRTDAFVRVARDLRFGTAEPSGPASARGAATWRFGGPDEVDELAEVVASGRVRESLVALRPRHFVYQGLREALADLRRVEARGGWGVIPSGPTLRPGDIDERVPLLRRRLSLAGDPGVGQARTDLRVDSALEAAVRSFQHRHGLNEDGLVGRSTLAALNVPVWRRIEQVRVNLERARWIAHELPDTFVVVNVAGAKVYLLRDGDVAFETRAIVGTADKATPSFSAPMLYVDLNPTWTVPSGIVAEVLALARNDPGYLARQGIRVLDRSGRELTASEIDLSRYSATDFPYVFRQDPGPANALGRIKLMFPNEYSIYLHDTPTRGLFAQEERLFSHGCIRLDDPLGLTELVLADPLLWSRERLRDVIDEGKTRTIPLPRPVSVFVLYWTASVDHRGELHFYRDVYDRDATVLAELDAAADIGTLANGSR